MAAVLIVDIRKIDKVNFGGWVVVRPLLILASIMLCVGIGTCAINRHVINRAATGRPMDWAGDRVLCQKCGTPGVKWIPPNYNYHCDHCGANYRARTNLETHEIEVDW